MRLDVRQVPYDPRCARALVRLDGEEVRLAIMADEEGGEVLAYRTGPDGRVLREADGEPATERLRGRVEIVEVAGC